MRIDRKWIGDVGLAVLLALPTAALTRPAAHNAQIPAVAAAPHLQYALAERSPLQARFSLHG